MLAWLASFRPRFLPGVLFPSVREPLEPFTPEANPRGSMPSLTLYRLILVLLLVPPAGIASVALNLYWQDQGIIFVAGTSTVATVEGASKQPREKFSPGESVSFKVDRITNFSGDIRVTLTLFRVRDIGGKISMEVVDRRETEGSIEEGRATFYPRPMTLPATLPPGQYFLRCRWSYAPIWRTHVTTVATQLFQVEAEPTPGRLKP